MEDETLPLDLISLPISQLYKGFADSSIWHYGGPEQGWTRIARYADILTSVPLLFDSIQYTAATDNITSIVREELIGSRIYGIYRGAPLKVIATGTPTGGEVLFDSETGTLSFSYGLSMDEFLFIQYINSSVPTPPVPPTEGAIYDLTDTSASGYDIYDLSGSDEDIYDLTEAELTPEFLESTLFWDNDQSGNYKPLPAECDKAVSTMMLATEYGVNAYNHQPYFYRKSDGTLYGVWYGAWTGEFDGTSTVNYKKSTDNGLTWGDLVIAIPRLTTLRETIGTTKIKTNLAGKPIEFGGDFYMISVVAEPGDPGFLQPIKGILVAKVSDDDVVDTPFWVYVHTDTSADPGFPVYDYDPVLGPQILEILVGPDYQIECGGDVPELNSYAYDTGNPVGSTTCDYYEFTRVKVGEVYFRLCRNNFNASPAVQYYQISSDYNNWPDLPVKSNIPSSPQRPFLMQLSDGRTLVISGMGLDNSGILRRYLFIGISDLNSLRFRRENIYTIVDNISAVLKFAGQFKDGACAYAHAIQIDDEIVVAFSQLKEDIKIVRFKYSPIQPNT